jgi:transcriptional regulator with XRE-family HTH domain
MENKGEVWIYELLEEKGWTQKDLAAKLDKSPSEISKWLSGEHNLTLRTLTRLEVELGEDLIQIPKTRKFQVHSKKVIHLEFARSDKDISTNEGAYTPWKYQTSPVKSSVA